jgi:dTDP-4-amino-4,6-dideoxygalactose transaminase
MNEMEAAMGLCVLDEIDIIKQQRAQVWQVYQNKLSSLVEFQQWNPHSKNNHAYAPVLFKDEEELLRFEAKLKANDILPRRYFYPSLDSLDYLKTEQICALSRDIASRILCLPIYPALSEEEQAKVI